MVDNASTDGTLEWLQEQKDMTLVSNQENKGFPAGCNQGIKAAEPENDILLLNNDTIVLPNSIFWLRMGLYEEERIGTTGSMSNSVINGQRIEKDYEFYLDLRKYGTARHAGFGLGFERCVMYLTGMQNIRDVIPFPRTVNNCDL
ncbi:glycosyl transferase family 2 [human gut metagenome]|uniref:Glycosyl transferase family 2 n=1 Tax=human gut metagenome TaxID=408170 RepID=K1T2K3_9ZZZZ